MFRQRAFPLALTVSTLLVWALPALALRPLAERQLAADTKACAAVGDHAHRVAQARDDGTPLSTVVAAWSLPVDSPETSHARQQFYVEIYARPRLTPAEIKQYWESACLRERLKARQP